MKRFDVFYTKKLYPLQDGVLRIVETGGFPFYLTGGTALSRGYFQHRYSDDLDLFTNRNADFIEVASRMLDSIRQSYATEIVTNAADFVRIRIHYSGCDLLVDIVNDSCEHQGEYRAVVGLGKVDGLRNILSNKLTALFRFEAKDVADIVEICRHKIFSWPQALQDAVEKDAGVDAGAVAEILATVPEEELRKVKWIEEPDYGLYYTQLQVVSRDLLSGSMNSLSSANDLL